MKLTCDLCGGELEMKAVGAVCRNCGIQYGEERLGEKRSEIRLPVKETPSVMETLPVKETPSVKDVHRVREIPSKRPSAAETKKAQAKMKAMWIILALIGLFAFFGTLFSESAIVPVGSLAALLITLFIFKPWKVYGGKAI